MSFGAETATVFRGGGRRWFTLRAACKAEAYARVRKRFLAAGYAREDINESDVVSDLFFRTAKRYARVLFRAAKRAGAPA